MSTTMSRRTFLQGSAAVAAGVLLADQPAKARKVSPNEKLNIGVIGVGNRGWDNVVGVRGENIVALCDVDEKYLANAAREFPTAKTYNDFRKMLDRKDLDAIVVSTPDHTHAPATLWALESGRHVYCEKPLTHTVSEAREVAKVARRTKLATQMGTQIHATPNYRRVVEVIRSGAIGPVRECHHWAGTVWSGPGKRPADTPPVPDNLHWDLWLGPAPERPYSPSYHPAAWRGWWDFGGGTLGDMACHHMDLGHWALDLREPRTIEAEGPPPNEECAPEWMIVRYEYPARGKKPPVKLTWYSGDRRPHYFDEGRLPKWGNGSLFVGDRGMLLADYDHYVLLPEADFAGYKPPAPTIPDSPGHHAEWIAACKSGGPTSSNFDYAGALTESVLLGNVAYRTGRRLKWDAATLHCDGDAEADRYLWSTYRPGWRP